MAIIWAPMLPAQDFYLPAISNHRCCVIHSLVQRSRIMSCSLWTIHSLLQVLVTQRHWNHSRSLDKGRFLQCFYTKTARIDTLDGMNGSASNLLPCFCIPWTHCLEGWYFICQWCVYTGVLWGCGRVFALQALGNRDIGGVHQVHFFSCFLVSLSIDWPSVYSGAIHTSHTEPQNHLHLELWGH